MNDAVVNMEMRGGRQPVRSNRSRPRILYLAPAWPHEKSFGQQLRVLHVGRALQNFGELHLAVVSDKKDPQAVERTAGEFQIYCEVAARSSVAPGSWDRLRWWLDPHFQDASSFVALEPGKSRIRESLHEFDLVWINCLRLANMFGIWRWPHAMLDIDDVPSTYQITEWKHNEQLVERIKAGARVLTLKRRENLLRKRFTTLGVCSEADREYLGGGSHIHVIPNGFERPAVEPFPQPANPPRLGFIGVFTHPPNLDSIRWFMRECWPRIKQSVPDARLRLVGRESDGPLKPTHPDVDGLGFVRDTNEEIATWSAMIVPLRLGSGTRLKVGEAFSRKCPLVSTRFGALGYDIRDGQEAYLADTPDAFASACIRLLQNPPEARAMAERAWHCFLEKWTWEAIAPRIWSAAEDCLRLKAAT
jgi:glycosyltransferase involved in cell wall biosynthesis